MFLKRHNSQALILGKERTVTKFLKLERIVVTDLVYLRKLKSKPAIGKAEYCRSP